MPSGQSLGSGRAGAKTFVNSLQEHSWSDHGDRFVRLWPVVVGGIPLLCDIIINGYNYFDPPSDVSCHNPSDLRNGPCPSAAYVVPVGGAPPSFHPVEVNTAFSDGSVKFVKNTVSLRT